MVRVQKTLFLFLISSFIGVTTCFADNMSDIASGIEAYKNGNYKDCISKMQTVVSSDPTTAIGYYYLALAYTKTNNSDLAIQNYTKVINLGSDNTLVDLAKRGKSMLSVKKVEVNKITEKTKLQENSDSEEDYNPILNDSYVQSENKSAETKKVQHEKSSENKNTVKNNNAKFEFDPNREPTNDEIVNAIKILQKAGLLQNGAAAITGGNQTPAQPQQYPQQYQQMPQMDSRAQQMYSMMQMMNNGNNNNGMMNMMPYMQNGGKVDPQLMQMMLMQQMMPNFSNGNNNGGY